MMRFEMPPVSDTSLLSLMGVRVGERRALLSNFSVTDSIK